MYFKSKEDLLKYFIQEEIENMKEIVEEVEKKNQEFCETAKESIIGQDCSYLQKGT